MSVVVHVSQHDSTVHAQGFSHLNGEADYHDIIVVMLLLYCLCKSRVVYKRALAQAQGSIQLSWGSLVLVWEGHRPSVLAISVPLMEQEYITYREVFIICSFHLHVLKFCLGTLC